MTYIAQSPASHFQGRVLRLQSGRSPCPTDSDLLCRTLQFSCELNDLGGREIELPLNVVLLLLQHLAGIFKLRARLCVLLTFILERCERLLANSTLCCEYNLQIVIETMLVLDRTLIWFPLVLPGEQIIVS